MPGARSNSQAAMALALMAAAIPVSMAQGRKALVVTSAGAPAYAEAVKGIRASLTGAVVTIAPVDRTGSDETVRARLAEKPDVVLSVGSAALAAVSAEKFDAPLVATMVLDSEPDRQRAAVVTLEVPPAIVLSRLKQVFPGRRRIAVIRGPALSQSAVSEILAEARKLGLEAQIVDCPGPKQVLGAAAAVRGKADFLWCLPDRAIYQGPTVTALTMSAIRDGLALVGFSEGIVQAGALAGFYPDYEDVGLQAGESALRILAGGRAGGHERPRKIRMAFNSRVARVLGFEPRSGGKDMVVVR